MWQSAATNLSPLNELLKSKKITSDKDLTGLHKFFYHIESHVRTLQGLGIESKNYGSLLAPIILGRLSHQLKLIITRNLKDEIWDLDKILLLINEELRARESFFFFFLRNIYFIFFKNTYKKINNIQY